MSWVFFTNPFLKQIKRMKIPLRSSVSKNATKFKNSEFNYINYGGDVSFL